ncbi:hypothetical protein RhiXN_05676 [Rhizoctonia solani]|uniref:Uncharacterized protein n=1 Tax=Rhizoctonia solani TaxID=456999 RepID=A0A8H8NZ26_9AGAM|nr:uncharacterized protein RhiXN_05676 [Rhizoctonia solani]QRW20687.1 hypothetical protein RhiXN_05676 [Rhizoctonia solani]
MGPPVQLEEATNSGNYDQESNGNEGSNIECNESKARVKGMDECKEPVRSRSEEPLPPQGRSWNKAQGVFIENYPNPLAGAPVSNKKQDPPDLVAYMRDCGPLGNPTIFETTKILMTTVPTDEGKDLHIKSTLYCGRVPWDKVEDLLHHVDQLPHGANWRIIEIEVHVEGKDVPHVAHLCAQDVVKIVVELMGNPWFVSYMKFAPERHWTAKKDGERIYNEMWTGDWWWNIQQLLNKAFGDATVAALIVSSNKTQVSILPGGQQVYPVYVLLGNICKSL